MMDKQFISSGIVFSLLLLLSGCSCEKSKKSEDLNEKVFDTEVLVTQNGKTLLTVGEFQVFMNDAMGVDPQMQLMAQFMPDFEEQVFDRAKLSEIVLNEWAVRNNVKDDAEYKKMRDQAEKALSTMLNQKMFIKMHVGEISDNEAKDYYNDHKAQDQNLMMSPDGVEAKGLSFETEAVAQSFFNKVNELKGDIVQAAKEVNKEVEDLGLVSQMSMIDPTVKEKVLEAKKTQAVLPVIKAGEKEYWVIKVFNKQKAQYIPFEQVIDRIKETLMNKKIEETFDKKMPEYQKEFNIQVNRSYFESKKKEKEEMQAKMMQAMREEKESAPSTDEQSKELAQTKTMQKAA